MKIILYSMRIYIEAQRFAFSKEKLIQIKKQRFAARSRNNAKERNLIYEESGSCGAVSSMQQDSDFALQC